MISHKSQRQSQTNKYHRCYERTKTTIQPYGNTWHFFTTLIARYSCFSFKWISCSPFFSCSNFGIFVYRSKNPKLTKKKHQQFAFESCFLKIRSIWKFFILLSQFVKNVKRAVQTTGGRWRVFRRTGSNELCVINRHDKRTSNRSELNR